MTMIMVNRGWSRYVLEPWLAELVLGRTNGLGEYVETLRSDEESQGAQSEEKINTINSICQFMGLTLNNQIRHWRMQGAL